MITNIHQFIPYGSIFPDKRKNNSWYLGINGNL